MQNASQLAEGGSERAAPPADRPAAERLGLLFLLAFSLLLYVITVKYDFVADDKVLLESNPYLQSFHYLREILTGNFWSFLGARGESTYYRPVVMLTLLVERMLFGLRPAGFHLLNVLLNGLVVLLVYRLGKRLWPQGRGAIWGAWIFAALPVHIENVAPVSGLSDLECALFFMLAAVFYTRPPDAQGRVRRTDMWLAGAMFLLAALCKEVALVLPPLLILYEHGVRFDGPVPWRERLSRCTPVLLLTALYLAIRVAVVGGVPRLPAAHTLGWKSTLGFTLGQLGAYVYKLLWPQHLSYAWKFQPLQAWRSPAVLFGFLAVLAAVRAWVYFWPRDRRVAFAFAWFFLTLAPALNLGGWGVTAPGERYLYIPSIAICWLAGEGLSTLRVWQWQPHGWRMKSLAQSLFAVLVGVAAVRTAVHLPVWQNNFTLAEATLQEDPNVATYHLFLGNIYRERGERGRARVEYVNAMALDPSLAQAYLDMAAVLWDDGAADAARQFLERAVEVNPRLAEGFYEMGRVELWQHHPERAPELFLKAVELNPNYFDALLMLGTLSLDQGRFFDAEEFLTRAVRVNPSSAEAHLDLGSALARLNSLPSAEAEFQRAIGLAPGSEQPYLSLAALYEQEGKGSAAFDVYQHAILVRPDSGNARFRLGVLALRMGRVAEAVQALGSAVALKPASALAHEQLGLAYIADGKKEEARRELETALRLQPNNLTLKEELLKLH